MSDQVFEPKAAISDQAYVRSMDQYHEMYKESLDNPSRFWGDVASQFHWETKLTNPDKICAYNFDIQKGPIYNHWMVGATTNICYNLLDRNVRNGNGDKVAFYW